MGKVTSKLQVTVPKAIAEEYRIKPGDEIIWTPSGDSIRVRLRDAPASERSTVSSLRLFDDATKRQRARKKVPAPSSGRRGWSRQDLYSDLYEDLPEGRGRSR